VTRRRGGNLAAALLALLFTEHFGVQGHQLRGFENGAIFEANDIVIRESDRFEGLSDPDACRSSMRSRASVDCAGHSSMQTGHGTLVDVATQRALLQQLAGDVVEREALTQILQLLCRLHGSSSRGRSARRAPGKGRIDRP
jgi:hypothetical protein